MNIIYCNKLCILSHVPKNIPQVPYGINFHGVQVLWISWVILPTKNYSSLPGVLWIFSEM